jgi:ribosomal protein L11 methyltransferase
MTQVRFHAEGSRASVTPVFDRLDARFGEEGAPVSMVELDEAADRHEVSVYFEDGEEVDADAVHAAFAPLSPAREDLPDIDWMASVLADLKPVRAGRFLVHGAHDRHQVRPHDLAIEIEAGQAFGTGHHETTAGCLEMAGRLIARRRPRRVLDLGTGSAVLAIGVAKLARIAVTATDIDPVAVRVAAANARLNGVHTLVRTRVATGLEGGEIRERAPFDLILANILAGPLMRMAPQMAAVLTPGGDLVLSGILARQRRAVLAAYRGQGIYHRATLWRGDWVTLHLSR